MSLGKHILADFYDCNPKAMNCRRTIEKSMNDAAIHSGATVVESVFHEFNPIGVSGVVVIAESHLTIHTWPEYNFASIDVFTCGDLLDPKDAVDYLETAFEAGRVDVNFLERGQKINAPHKMIVPPSRPLNIS